MCREIVNIQANESPLQLAREVVLVVSPHPPLLLLLLLVLLALHAPLMRPFHLSNPFFLLINFSFPIITITTLDVHQLNCSLQFEITFVYFVGCSKTF